MNLGGNLDENLGDRPIILLQVVTPLLNWCADTLFNTL